MLLRSEIHSIERIEIIQDLRMGEYDVLVGVNLLREGLDLPEVSLVAILDADKEGFLRAERSLIQTIGRAARHVEGVALLYADNFTDSMKRAISETVTYLAATWVGRLCGRLFMLELSTGSHLYGRCWQWLFRLNGWCFFYASGSC